MSKESYLIRMISNVMPRSEYQLNKLFESDSEIIAYGDSKMLFTMDEFSGEDMLREHDPFTLGWNIAVGAVSDILASGGKPLFYAHSMTVDEKWDTEFIRLFSEGIACVLKECGAGFIGGDFGKSSVWRYTATVVGSLEGKPLLRSGASVGDGIFISGKIGTGNLEAFLKLYSEKKLAGKLTETVKSRFHLRLKESGFIRQYATACIDTSDGVFNGINTISEMSGTGFAVSDLPYVKTGALAAKLFSMPKALLFLGECGEYELLFTIAAQNEEKFMNEARQQSLQFYKIGKITEASRKVLLENKRETNLHNMNIRARDYDDIKAYLKALIEYMKD